MEAFAGFDWDDANRGKCLKHGVSRAEIEALLRGPVMVRPDAAHSRSETRFQAVEKNGAGRSVFLVFTIRTLNGDRYIRPISARYMHHAEVEAFEEANSGI